ncbi:hypothetical protein LTR09_008283 [Extremus antarcticus]|uniref:Uncharacterized protein n=1 Tax=Extremus antarcticus TaxID=702011 RepID=A0AAJ0DBA2_9PEZI|nr:hypothetical protein LTR09_008283 [Extremus antarcticus]
MARLRSAPTSQQPATTTTQTKRPALKEKTNTTRTKVPVYEDDGNTEGLVKDARPRRGRPKATQQNEDELIMAGGLGQASSDDKILEQSAPPPTTDELVKSDGPPPPTAKANRRPARVARKAAQSESDRNVMEGIKKRMQPTASAQTATTHKKRSSGERPETSSDSLPTEPPPPRKSANSLVERSEFSISPSPPPPVQPGSALRSNGTPAVESSILALKNFKRRPRQPSMLQMVQQRTASARPSAAHFDAADDEDVYDLDDDVDDVEDFEPDAEGTPLHMSKKTQPGKAKSKRSSNLQRASTPIVKPVASASVTKKRKSDAVDTSSTSVLDALKAKRRRTSTAQEEDYPIVSFRRSPSVHQTSPAQAASSTPRVSADVQVVHSSISSTPPTEPSSSPMQRRPSLDENDDLVVPSTEQEREDLQYVPLNDLEEQEPEVDANGTMAEPASSSPAPLEPSAATQRTDIMTEPLTQVTPPRPQREKPTKKKKAVPVTTAALQDLLPKRRQPLKPRHRKSEYDIDSASEDDNPLDTSHLEYEEDELGGKLRRQTKSKPAPKGKKGKATAARTKPRQSKGTAQPARKSSMAPPSRKSTAAKKTTKTYGRAAPTSDKENEDGYQSLEENDDSVLPDTSISMIEAARSKELEAAKRKFAKVDEWDMEFESMSFEEHRSSSQGWR